MGAISCALVPSLAIRLTLHFCVWCFQDFTRIFFLLTGVPHTGLVRGDPDELYGGMKKGAQGTRLELWFMAPLVMACWGHQEDVKIDFV